MRWCPALLASATLILGGQAPALAGHPAETPYSAAEAAVAVAIGLAWANSRRIEMPVTVEIAPNPPAQPVEWIRICGPNGCQLIPRPARPGDLQTVPEDRPLSTEQGPGGVSASLSSGDNLPGCGGDSCGLWGKRRFFGRRQ
jgi:hypothetical protein